MTEPINIPIDMEVRAKATLNLTNTETGEVQTMSMGAPEGMILDHYPDWAMQRGLGLLGDVTFNRCYLGTGDTPVQPTDTGLSGSQLAMSSSSVLTKGLTDLSQKFEHLNTIEGLGVGNTNQLAVTSDESILLVGVNPSTEEVAGLRAFLIDKENWTLSLLEVPDFEELENLGCQALSCGGEYLFVGLNQTPWGKLYEKDGNDFIFLSDVSGLTAAPTQSDISEDGKFLLVRGAVYEIKDEGGQVSVDLISSIPNIRNSIFLDDSTTFCATGSGVIQFYRIEDGEINLTQEITGLSTYIRPLAYTDGVLYVANSSTGAGRYAYVFLRDSEWYLAFTLGNIVTNVIGLKGIAVFIGISVRNRNIEFSNINTAVVPDATASGAVLKGSDVVFLRIPGESLSGIGIYKLRQQEVKKQSYARKWTFPAGTGTGIVNEVAIQATTGSGSDGNNRYFLRFVLPEGFEKTDLHQLEVEVEAEIENPGVWEGVILGGSRDESDVAYRITMNENQFRNFITTGYNNLSSWFGTSGTPNVRIGTSNEDTDLVFDRENIRGHEIEYISSSAIREVIPYVSGSLERTIRLFLEVTQGNGKIGEIVFGNRFCRITFDPPLNKYDPEGVDAGRDPSTRLYMNLVFGWKREEE
jgi:hypothetical protein